MHTKFHVHARNPDISQCRAMRSGQSDLMFCLNEDRVFCDYCLPFGESFFCRHPQGRSIAARSEAQNKEAQNKEAQNTEAQNKETKNKPAA